MSGTLPGGLDSCGCCEGLPALSAEQNDPGQPALAYRLGTYADFFQRMVSQIQSPGTLTDPPQIPWTLDALTTRSPDDPVIALMDAWAVVADVITFYQERIANEAFLRTATERQSILQLARAIGYELNPGVAASAWLAFTVEDVIGATVSPTLPQTPKTPSAPSQGAPTYNAGIVLLPAGTQTLSIPPQGAMAQTFETASDLAARSAWNILLPRLTRPADLAIGSGGALYLIGTRAGFPPGAPVLSLPADGLFLLSADTPAPAPGQNVAALAVQQLYLSGNALNIAVNDRLLLVGQNCVGATMASVFVVRNVVVLPAQAMTRVDFVDAPGAIGFAPAQFASQPVPAGGLAFTQANVETYVLNASIDESDLQALIRISLWDPDSLADLANTMAAPAVWTQGVFSFAAEAAFFGHNAPLWSTLPALGTNFRGGADPYLVSWDLAHKGAGTFIWTNSQGVPNTDATVFLERSFPQILDDSWAIIEAPGLAPTAFRIIQARDKSLADYSLSLRCTGLTLQTAQASPLVALGSPCAIPLPTAGESNCYFIGADGAAYVQFASLATDAWQPAPVWLGGTQLLNTPCVVAFGPSPLEIFAVCADGKLYHQWFFDGLWWGWFSLGGGNLVDSPQAVAWALNALDVFAMGADGNVAHFWFNGIWNGPENLGGASPNGDHLVNSPAVIARGPSPIEIFAVAADGYLYHKWWTAGWLGWERLGGGNLAGSPSVLAWAYHFLDVFVIGTDGNLYQFWLAPTGWSGPALVVSVGNALVGSPAAVSGGPNAIDIVANRADGALHHFWFNATSLSWGNENLGPPTPGTQPAPVGAPGLVGSPAMFAYPGQQRLDVFAAANDGCLYHSWWGGRWSPFESLGGPGFLTRKSTAQVQSQMQVLSEIPVSDDIPAGSTALMLNGLVLGLTPGQAIALSGMRADARGVSAAEVLIAADIVHDGGFTTIEFTAGSQFAYTRSTLTLSANTVQATSGATIAVPEILGSGNASVANQSFTLKRTPLTWISASTQSGSASSLQISVNGMSWREAPSLYGLGPNDLAYTLRVADDATATVTFGDGVCGARLPTGQNNVTAMYRTGLGVAGNVAAASIAILQSRPPGLRGVSNPLPGAGGADPEDLAAARGNAPLTVLTLGRIVSLEDYEDFAAGFAGIGKAQAVPLWDGHAAIVHVTVAGIGGAPVDVSSGLYTSLAAAIDAARDPVQMVRIASYQPALFNLTAAVIVATPTYSAPVVLAAVGAALVAYFAFDQRGFAQPVTAAEVVATIQAVPGVTATTLSQLYRNGDPSGPGQTEPAAFLGAAAAQAVGGVLLPAEMLLLNPIGFSITEKLS